MPKTKNAYLRYLVIHSAIKSNKYRKGYPTKQDLFNALEDQGLNVSFSSIEKDLGFLKNERGAPLRYDRAQECYVYTDQDYEFDIPLGPEEVRMLRMLIHKMEIFGEAPEFRMVKDSIDRLSDHFNLTQQHPDDKIDRYILFEYTRGFAGSSFLSPIYDAIYEHKEIEFTHCRFESDEPTHRILKPFILKEHRNRYYVIGKERDEPRIFGLDRMCDLTVTDRYFTEDPDFYDEVLGILRDSVGVMAFGFQSQDVLLHFDRPEAKYVKSLMLHRSQEIVEENENGMTVRLHVKVTREFIMDCILRYGDSVRVLEPQSLAEEIRKIHKTAAGKYRKLLHISSPS